MSAVMCAIHAPVSAHHDAVSHAMMLCVDFRGLRRFRAFLRTGFTSFESFLGIISDIMHIILVYESNTFEDSEGDYVGFRMRNNDIIPTSG
jgi:hypothetical protein